MSPLIAFIIGSGPGVGIATARLFAKQGYKVVVGSRKPDVESVKQEGFVPVAVDIAKHETITTAFSDIESQLGGPPNVVIFNAASHVPLPVEEDPFSLPYDTLAGVSNGGLSVYAAAQHAVAGFRNLKEGPRAFIVTGNLLPFVPPMTPFFALNIQKRIAAAVVEQGATSYEKDGFRFYFAHEVSQTGGPVFPPNGDGHAKAFWRLIQANEQLKWEQRFLADGSDRSV